MEYRNFIMSYNESGEPYFVATFGKTEIICDRENTTVFTHSQLNKEYDHLFISDATVDEAEFAERALGSYVFRNRLEKKNWNFDLIGSVLLYHDYPRIHRKEPADCDVNAFFELERSDLNQIPEGWGE